MSTTTPPQKKTGESTPEQFEFATADEQHVNVRNCEKNTIYTTTLSSDAQVATKCTCLDYKYRHSGTVGGKCKHMNAVEGNLADIRSDRSNPRGEERITGPHSAYAPTPRPEEFDHYTYWRCEACGAECDDKRALEECC